jgi:hypothetical protein
MALPNVFIRLLLVCVLADASGVVRQTKLEARVLASSVVRRQTKLEARVLADASSVVRLTKSNSRLELEAGTKDLEKITQVTEGITFATKGFCPPIVDETRTLVHFEASHKTGSFLRTAGAWCLQQYFKTVDKSIAVWARGDSAEDCAENPVQETNHDAVRFRKVDVHWVRDPFTWMQSNYLYSKRGDEDIHFNVFMDKLRQPDIFAKLSSIWSKPHVQSFPSPLPQESYSTYLGRVSEDEGLFVELFRVSGNLSKGSLADLRRESVEGGNRFSVCLDDFMKSHSSFMAAWRRILDRVGDNHYKDSDLDTCLSNIDPSINKIAHATSPGQIDASRIQNSIRRLDARYFGGEFARVAREISCPRY